jgi:uncharacterized protein YjiK
MKKIKTLPVIALLFFFLVPACKRIKQQSPPGYDLSTPQQLNLPAQLSEISGIVYYKPDNCVFAQCDEKAILYKIPLSNPAQITRWKIGKKDDFEDLALIDSNFFFLVSNGDILRTKYVAKDSFYMDRFTFPGSNNEFEAMYYDSSQRKLILICKDCKDGQKTQIATFGFDPVTFQYSKTYSINTEKISKQLKKEDKKFKPSASALNPITGELYIVASVNKLLIITDGRGNIRHSIVLNTSIFKQPEGLTFMPSGDLLISNEFAGSGDANILIFQYNQGVKK